MDERARHFSNLYDELLERSHFASTVEVLAKSTELHDLKFGGRPVCSSLRPLFVSEREYGEAKRITDLVARGLLAAYRRVLDDEEFRNSLGFSPPSQAFFEFDRAHRPAPFVGRIDAFLGEKGIRFIEFNPMPFGITFMDVLGEVFASMPIMTELSALYATRWPRTREIAFKAMQAAKSAPGRGASPTLGIVMKTTQGAPSPATHEQNATIRSLEERGTKVVHASVHETECRDERLWMAGQAIDIVAVEDPGVLAEAGFGHPLFNAIRQGHVRYLNGIASSATLGTKALFALVSDPANASMFDRDVAAAIAEHVPWTRIVRDGRTTRAGVDVDLMATISEHRSELVLKPAEGSKGEGVVLGWDCTDEQWNETLKRAKEVTYVVQDRVDVPRMAFPREQEGKLVFTEVQSDFNLYVWNGDRSEGAFARVAPRKLLNLTAGDGSAVPLFIVGDRR